MLATRVARRATGVEHDNKKKRGGRRSLRARNLPRLMKPGGEARIEVQHWRGSDASRLMAGSLDLSRVISPKKRAGRQIHLKSRRHPLPSRGPLRLVRTGEHRREGPSDAALRSSTRNDPSSGNGRHSREPNSYFFFFAALRVFFAAFLAAPLAFDFFAFFAMLPSRVCEMA